MITPAIVQARTVSAKNIHPNISFKQLSKNDNTDSIYAMFQEIGPGENGFQESGYKYAREDFATYLKEMGEMAKGIGLPEGFVAQTRFVLYDKNYPIGICKVRHRLSDALRINGGHIGYCVRPSERNKGYGNLLLTYALQEAKKMNILEVLITVNEGNTPSRNVVQNNGGVLAKIENNRCYYWILQGEPVL